MPNARRIPSLERLLRFGPGIALCLWTAGMNAFLLWKLSDGSVQAGVLARAAYGFASGVGLSASLGGLIANWRLACADHAVYHRHVLRDLIFSRRPDSALEASAWWWGRLSLYCFVILGVWFLLAFAVAAWLRAT